MTYCAQCGYALKDGTAICPSCGAKNIGGETEVKPVIPQEQKMPEAAPALKEETSEVYPIPAPEQTQKETPTVKTGYSDNAYPTGKYAPMTVWGYLVFSVLYMIPAVGLVAAIITALATKRVAKKRFAVSAIILQLISLLLVGGAAAAVVMLGVEAIKALF